MKEPRPPDRFRLPAPPTRTRARANTPAHARARARGLRGDFPPPTPPNPDPATPTPTDEPPSRPGGRGPPAGALLCGIGAAGAKQQEVCRGEDVKKNPSSNFWHPMRLWSRADTASFLASPTPAGKTLSWHCRRESLNLHTF